MSRSKGVKHTNAPDNNSQVSDTSFFTNHFFNLNQDKTVRVEINGKTVKMPKDPVTLISKTVVAARKVPIHQESLANSYDEHDELADIGVFVSVEAGGVTNASSVVWARKSGSEFRRCPDYMVHVNS